MEMRKAIAVAMILLAVGAAAAQQPGLAAQGASGMPKGPAGRPADAMPKAPSEILDTDKYPFAEALRTLQANPPVGPPAGGYVVPSVTSAAEQRAVARLQEPDGVRKHVVEQPAPSVVLHREPVGLSASAEEGLAEGERAKAEPTVTTTGKDGRVLFTYGVGLPTVICAPLRVCTIELEPGEKIKGEPAIGDSTRWEILPASAGSGDLVTPILVIKPRGEGLDTNLVVTTDKRTYYLRLVSKAKEYIARTAFTYKDDEEKAWQQYLQQQEERDREGKARSVVAPLVGDALDRLNFEYKITGGSESIRPVRVIDDGVKTYITMPHAAMTRELPALIVESIKGKGEKAQEMVNYRVKENIYIVDRLFDRAALILGEGKNADRVEIRRVEPVSGGR
jgi:type IV secretion system protein VirB9